MSQSHCSMRFRAPQDKRPFQGLSQASRMTSHSEGRRCKPSEAIRTRSGILRLFRSGAPRNGGLGTIRLAFVALIALIGLCAGEAAAGPVLVIEMPSGNVLYEDHATEPWYPASLTKLMTAYVALSAVHNHEIGFDTPLAVSARAASMPPSKMGFRPGTLVTLGNALKMLMVKSANDMAVTIAEGVSGSVEAFADDMNEAARSLGMAQSHFVNPNGLPNPEHVSSARDLAILARALYLTFPREADLFNIGALQLEGKIIRNHNDLLGRYPGTDGMKTGFTCAAGFNIVASATQGGRKLIAVILGAPNVHSRAMMAATLFDRAFAGIDKPSRPVEEIAVETPQGGSARDAAVCHNRGKAVGQYHAAIERLMAPLLAAAPSSAGHLVLTTTDGLARTSPIATRIAMVPAPAFDPVRVYVGPPQGYDGLVAQARPPHSPIGTPQAPGTVSAYAPQEPEAALAEAPLHEDAKALPMRGREVKAERRRPSFHRHHRLTKKEMRAAKALPAKKPNKPLEKPAKAASGKTAGKQPAKPAVQKHAKATVKSASSPHPPAKKVATHPAKATGKKPEKHAKR